MMQNLALAVFAGGVSGVLYASLITGSVLAMILAYVAMLPLLLIGLTHGTVAVGVAGLAGTAALAVFGELPLAISFAVVFFLPATALIRQALLNRPNAAGSQEWYPSGLILTWLGGIAIVVFGAAELYLLTDSDALGGLSATVRATVERLDPASAPAATDESLRTVALFVPLMGASWMIMVIINGALAQLIAGRLGRNRRPSAPLSDVTLPSAFGLVLAASGAALWLADGVIGYLSALIAAVATTTLLLQGLAVVHGVLRSRPWRGLGLAGFYLALLILSQFLAPVVVLLGLVEPWARLRERFGSVPGVKPG
ncbi:MAG: DUF2232 domain-containing protein [Alphaproteobacteria bacterium]|nr:DUF2232 domain-containing protein [Alphaproteobacteria bacterium]